MPPVNGFADEDNPFPERISTCRASRVKIAPVGYQPVGMKPSTNDRAGLLTSIHAALLVSALATSSVRPSGESATASGVEVGGCSGNRLVEICSIASFENVSNTPT